MLQMMQVVEQIHRPVERRTYHRHRPERHLMKRPRCMSAFACATKMHTSSVNYLCYIALGKVHSFNCWGSGTAIFTIILKATPYDYSATIASTVSSMCHIFKHHSQASNLGFQHGSRNRCDVGSGPRFSMDKRRPEAHSGQAGTYRR